MSWLVRKSSNTKIAGGRSLHDRALRRRRSGRHRLDWTSIWDDLAKDYQPKGRTGSRCRAAAATTATTLVYWRGDIARPPRSRNRAPFWRANAAMRRSRRVLSFHARAAARSRSGGAHDAPPSTRSELGARHFRIRIEPHGLAQRAIELAVAGGRARCTSPATARRRAGSRRRGGSARRPPDAAERVGWRRLLCAPA